MNTGVHVTVTWFLNLDFPFGRKVGHTPLGRLQFSRLGRTTLSWEQDRSLKKRKKMLLSGAVLDSVDVQFY